MATEVSTPFPAEVTILSAQRNAGGSEEAHEDTSWAPDLAGAFGVPLSLRGRPNALNAANASEISELLMQNRFRHSLQRQQLGPMVRMEREFDFVELQFTEMEFVHPFKEIDAEIVSFAEDRGLREGLIWLHMAIPHFFPDSEFELGVIPGEEGEDPMLAVKVYGDLRALEFRNCRDAMCEAMLEAGHEDLYEVVSIFQRRVQRSEWQGFPWYRAVLAE